MFKNHKRTLILTTLVILLPLAAGLLLWTRLPNQIPIHWNSAGEVDGWAGKAFSVLGLPLFLTALHWLCIFGVHADPKRQNIDGKPLMLVLWIVPAVSLMGGFLMYGTALGYELNAGCLTLLLVGLLFVILGNWMPKCRPSYTVGYRVPWTLANDENWTRTHRLAGKLFILGGLILLVSAFLGGWSAALIFALVLTAIPAVYSYLLYRRGL